MSESVDVLQVADLTVRYGHVEAVRGVDLRVGAGEVVTVLGPNGAGKTSLLRALAGASAGTVEGRVQILGHESRRRRPHVLVKRGLVLVPEGRQIIAPLTVEENLHLGGYRQRSRARGVELLDRVYELFPVLHERRNGVSGLLSGGEQQMLAFGRALMADPQLILMDEPSMGLSPAMVDRVMQAVSSMNESGVAILLVEQNATAAFTVADRAYVLDQGKTIRSGTVDEIRHDPIVVESFLGLREHTEAAR